MPIVTETGFADDGWTRDKTEAWSARPLIGALEDVAAGAARGLDLAPDATPAEIAPYFERLALIAVRFPSFGDGRGFTLAQRLRALGFTGRLRAVGALLPDQHAYARACGFDEIEIDAARALRQPEPQWLADLGPRGDYRARLRGAA